jgi:site-specific DNA-methyltransferase (adenine-specific)
MRILLADPPWKYRNYGAPPGETHDRARGAAKHYPCMKLPEIKALPVAGCRFDVLFLWTTWPLIENAFELIPAWGFIYKTLAWEWIKTTKDGSKPILGMGSYTRSNPEPCLLAFGKHLKGKGLPVSDRSVPNLLFAPRREHSQKPDEQYDRIERLYPGALTKVEMFARQEWPGWIAWGNEVDNRSS